MCVLIGSSMVRLFTIVLFLLLYVHLQTSKQRRKINYCSVFGAYCILTV